MAKSQYFYATQGSKDVEGNFFTIINKMGHAELGFTITEPTPEAARQSEVDNGFEDPTAKGSALYKVTIERVGN